MLSFMRGQEPKRIATASKNPVYYEDSTSWMQFYPPSNRYFVTHHLATSASFFNPPTHLHFNQVEYFHVREGTGIFYLPTATNPVERVTVKKAGDDPIRLPAGIYHKFENASPSQSLEVDIQLDPLNAPRGKEESFFRNFFGYLEDCKRDKVEPSIFQLQLFLNDADAAIAIPLPGSDGLKWWISKIINIGMGVIVGEWLLGYKRTYPEYYQEQYTLKD